MEYKNALFKVDPHSPLPIHIQVQEQIKLLIGMNLLKPGDMLPSTNQLADQLTINRNTIQSVYSQLKADGLLVTQKGKGTQIAGSQALEQFKKDNQHFAFMEKMITDAKSAGHHIEKICMSGLAYTQLFKQPLQRKRQYLFIECKMNACTFYLEEIKRMTSMEIEQIDISSPKADLIQAIKQADLIVTRADLAKVVQDFLEDKGKKLISVSDTKDVSLLLEMLA